ncbi:pyrroline-5-carboxylate reductase [Legionella worsleiensis]|uniref:Pyrroline-5-carboxylate reductase n=1 Tax=Legionella worsleiensis TaxID=45076 RepID=A0A0W1AJ44_9GAMM|nr:pyrroline-5-carboxylate reductase [Legionella worsleiensis]KTD81305.1 pyrroline-5-carboxylate reductase [Legionella worsleiensis]STY30792.1 pyrroline-5-carboxylate reductase [Legionella worsleiensis]
MNISFIGFGAMAKAIARGLEQEKSFILSAAAPSLTKGVNKEGIITHHENKEIIKNADIIILAVKPAQMSTVLTEITPFIPHNCLLISVAAGLSLPWFAQHCSSHQAVIRTMPNTPAAVGLAATPMIANVATTTQQKQWAELIFSKIGLITWTTNEEDMDVFTALSGSGPAYVFLFMEAMMDAAVALGLEPQIAKTFTLQTVLGTVNLALNDELGLSQLRTKVTSPGGTTAAALSILQEQLPALVFASMNAAKQRAHELGTLKGK